MRSTFFSEWETPAEFLVLAAPRSSLEPLDESRGYEQGHSFGVLGWWRVARRAEL